MASAVLFCRDLASVESHEMTITEDVELFPKYSASTMDVAKKESQERYVKCWYQARNTPNRTFLFYNDLTIYPWMAAS